MKIAANESSTAADIWAALAAPLPTGVISWRQDGRPIARDGRILARFVAYIEANTVRERLDSVVPGEWDLMLELLPPVSGLDEDANMGACNFKARLQILGVIREDVGTGKDYKQAATDAMKRVAVRFGIGHELYDYEQNWVQMDGDGKYAKPLEDPAVAYAKRYGRPKQGGQAGWKQPDAPALTSYGPDTAYAPEPAKGPAASGTDDVGATAKPSDEPTCPKCDGRMWDNRLTKRNPRAPDFKCRDRSCDGVIWPENKGNTIPPRSDEPPERDDSEIPF